MIAQLERTTACASLATKVTLKMRSAPDMVREHPLSPTQAAEYLKKIQEIVESTEIRSLRVDYPRCLDLLTDTQREVWLKNLGESTPCTVVARIPDHLKSCAKRGLVLKLLL